MAFYEYRCDKCGHKFEVSQKMSDEKLRTCPKCHTDNLKRLIGTGISVHFKGSGFYCTDYK